MLQFASIVAPLVEHGRISALFSLGVSLVCVLGIIFSSPLHIEAQTAFLSTIAEIALPTGIAGSVAHTYLQQQKGTNGNGSS